MHVVRAFPPPRLAADSVGLSLLPGFKDGGGKCGNATPLTPDEESEIRACIDVIALNDYTVDGVTYRGSDIASDLEAMLDGGQIAEGKGARGVGGCTFPDGQTGTSGDLMNIAPSKLTICDPELASVLAHEWMHTQQAGMSQACAEAQAYALGCLVYLLSGGSLNDHYYQFQSSKWASYSAACGSSPFLSPSEDPARGFTELRAQNIKLPGSNAPADGGSLDDGSFGNTYFVDEAAGTVFLWRKGGELSSFAPLSSHLFFDARHIAFTDHDVVLVFGSDTTSSSSPVGVLTSFIADSTHLFDRHDVVLTGVKHPCGVDYDPDTGRWYVLDGHLSGSGISIWSDTNADGIPDTPLGSPFAPTGFPGLAGAMNVVVAQHPSLGKGLIVTPEDLRSAGWHDYTENVTFLRDTDSDGTADASTSVPLMDFMSFAPTIAQIPTETQTQLRVLGIPNHVLEVWRCDASGGVLVQKLGSTTGAPTALNTINLNRSLVTGWYVEAIDLTSTTRLPSPKIVVGPAGVTSVPPAPLVGRIQPNPARAFASLRFELPKRGFVSSAVYDIAGRIVARLSDGAFNPGAHVLTWKPGGGTASGVYFWRVTIDGRDFRRTLIVAR